MAIEWLPEVDLGEEVKGTIHLTDKVDVTDPCYDDDVWCRVNNLKVVEGDYECVYQRLDNPYIGSWDETKPAEKHHDVRVSASMIRLVGVDYKDLEWGYRGTAGVDAGCCGFFPNKPNYKDEAWHNMVDIMAGENHDWQECAWITEDGFWTNSGFGDGSYPVFVGYKKGEDKASAVAILFLADPYGIDPNGGWDEEDEDE